MNNPILFCDGYKIGHIQMYNKGMTRLYSNWTPRMSRILWQDEVVACGFQYFFQKYLMEEFGTKFFGKPVDEVCFKYERRINGYLGPNTIGSAHIRALHNLGYLPLEFKAIPEGTRVPLRVPMLTVENTHDDFAWLTNYIETLMSNVLWKACTSATNALRMRAILDKAAEETGSPMDFVPWQGHDFSMRGMSGIEDASLSGMGHLLFFTGTDTLPAIDLIEEYYTPPDGYFIAGSVPATEHSISCAGGEDTEEETYSRLLDSFPTGILSVVSDTWDLWKVLTQTLPNLKDKIMARNGKLVIRPDSGSPVKIVCGDPSALAGSPANKGVIQLLWEVFGGTTNDKGFKVLDSHIGCIYGDSITHERASAITAGLKANGFASCNMVFGVGSYTYQYVTRDTFGFAMKATWCMIDGVGHDLFKKPITDDGMKNSAKGRLAVHKDENGKLFLINQATPEQEAASELKPVWRDGRLLKYWTFDEVRAIAMGK